MMKRLVLVLVALVFVFSTVGAYAEKSPSEPTSPPMETTKDRASRAMNNMFYGPSEIPENMVETKTKGTQMERCTTKTKTGVERGIARFFTGAWQLATFWYSEPDPARAATQK